MCDTFICFLFRKWTHLAELENCKMDVLKRFRFICVAWLCRNCASEVFLGLQLCVGTFGFGFVVLCRGAFCLTSKNSAPLICEAKQNNVRAETFVKTTNCVCENTNWCWNTMRVCERNVLKRVTQTRADTRVKQACWNDCGNISVENVKTWWNVCEIYAHVVWQKTKAWWWKKMMRHNMLTRLSWMKKCRNVYIIFILYKYYIIFILILYHMYIYIISYLYLYYINACFLYFAINIGKLHFYRTHRTHMGLRCWLQMKSLYHITCYIRVRFRTVLCCPWVRYLDGALNPNIRMCNLLIRRRILISENGFLLVNADVTNFVYWWMQMLYPKTDSYFRRRNFIGECRCNNWLYRSFVWLYRSEYTDLFFNPARLIRRRIFIYYLYNPKVVYFNRSEYWFVVQPRTLNPKTDFYLIASRIPPDRE